MMLLIAGVGHGQILPASILMLRTVIAAPPFYQIREKVSRLGSSSVGRQLRAAAVRSPLGRQGQVTVTETTANLIDRRESGGNRVSITQLRFTSPGKGT